MAARAGGWSRPEPGDIALRGRAQRALYCQQASRTEACPWQSQPGGPHSGREPDHALRKAPGARHQLSVGAMVRAADSPFRDMNGVWKIDLERPGMAGALSSGRSSFHDTHALVELSVAVTEAGEGMVMTSQDVRRGRRRNIHGKRNQRECERRRRLAASVLGGRHRFGARRCRGPAATALVREPRGVSEHRGASRGAGPRHRPAAARKRDRPGSHGRPKMSGSKLYVREDNTRRAGSMSPCGSGWRSFVEIHQIAENSMYVDNPIIGPILGLDPRTVDSSWSSSTPIGSASAAPA